MVEILAARDLEATDLLGTSDPYAVVTLGAQRRKTKVKHRTLRPVWAERFADVVAAKELEDDEVDVALYDHDAVGAHDFLGRIGIPVTSIEEGHGTSGQTGSNVRAHWVKLEHAKPPPEPFLGTFGVRRVPRRGCSGKAPRPRRRREGRARGGRRRRRGPVREGIAAAGGAG